MTDVLKGTRAIQAPRPNRTYGENRTCAHAGCETKLSRYNRSEHCWMHAEVKFPVVRGDRKKKNNKKRVAA